MATPPAPAIPTVAPLSLQSNLPYDMRLEILRLLQISTLARWANRREYEWKLSYAFWAALAGFIVTVTLGKDSRFSPPPTPYLLAWLGSMILLHGYYLYQMVDRTLQDIHAQCDIEITMHQLDAWVQSSLPPGNLGAGMGKRSWINKRYGLVAQIGITVLLSAAALWFGGKDQSNKVQLPAAPPAALSITCQTSPATTTAPAPAQPPSVGAKSR